MIRRLMPFALLFISAMLDMTVLPMLLGQRWYMPVLTLVGAISFGLLLGRTRGVLFGLTAGLLVDVLSATPLGLMTMLYAGAGYAAGWLTRRPSRSVLAPYLAGFACLAAFELFMAGYVLLASDAFEAASLSRAFGRAAISAVVLAPINALYRLILRPVRSPFSAV